MNYIEWVLQRSGALWREREETLRRRLALAPRAAEQRTDDAAQREESAARAQETADTAAADGAEGRAQQTARETDARRLAEKLGLNTAEPRETEQRALQALAGETLQGIARQAERAAEDSDAQSGGSAAWLRQELGKSGAAGARAADARGQDSFALPREQELRGTEEFSLSLERDARRYDGGFLYY